ncbi:type I-F CRISPR-associated endonuclease Cas1f [Pseudomonas aeruginosa]|nr:type I-F CRISPR-associated endonuclease Cas1f [Pseudomonas aeruginosa]
MDDISPSELKTILHSKRANLYYLQHCRVLVNGGRVEYVTDEGRHSHYWNIPIANTTSLLLGTGTSITQAAMRELARAGVLAGFCGGGGTPLFSANEVDVEVSWLTPQSEYRPTEYLQRWVGFWFDEEKRLEAARHFQRVRLERIRHSWLEDRVLRDAGFAVDATALAVAVEDSARALEQAPNHEHLLTEEARLSKRLFKLAAQATRYGEFVRASARQRRRPGQPLPRPWQLPGLRPRGDRHLGAGHSPWTGGATRQDPARRPGVRCGGPGQGLADPAAGISSAMRGDEEQDFRQACLDNLSRAQALDFMIDTLKDVAQRSTVSA